MVFVGDTLYLRIFFSIDYLQYCQVQRRRFTTSVNQARPALIL